jgi:hypothetical protein
MPKAHPLRPKHDYLLICEGDSDLQLLTGIYQIFAPEIFVMAAGGEANLATLTSILQPGAFYVGDRDFRISIQYAQDLLKNARKATNFWIRHDIEGYLLYEDWLWQAVEIIRTSPRFSNVPLENPITAQQITHDIQAVAMQLVVDHAGYHTIADIDRAIGKINRFTAKISSTPRNEAQWLMDLTLEIQRLTSEGQQLATLPHLDTTWLNTTFQNHLATYQEWANDLDAIRLHFSGKRIFEELALLWQASKQSRRYTWERLRDETSTQAIAYSRTIPQKQFHQDARLKDFGELANKISGL